jgi:hypothetical protein
VHELARTPQSKEAHGKDATGKDAPVGWAAETRGPNPRFCGSYGIRPRNWEVSEVEGKLAGRFGRLARNPAGLVAASA